MKQFHITKILCLALVALLVLTPLTRAMDPTVASKNWAKVVNQVRQISNSQGADLFNHKLSIRFKLKDYWSKYNVFDDHNNINQEYQNIVFNNLENYANSAYRRQFIHLIMVDLGVASQFYYYELLNLVSEDEIVWQAFRDHLQTFLTPDQNTALQAKLDRIVVP